MSAEGYSKKRYEAAKDKVGGAVRERERALGAAERDGAEIDRLREEVLGGLEEMKGLKGEAQTEATAANAEHDRLIAAAKTGTPEAVQALKDFERDQLGMHRDAA